MILNCTIIRGEEERVRGIGIHDHGSLRKDPYEEKVESPEVNLISSGQGFMSELDR